MKFNSLIFLQFFVVTYTLYLFLPHKRQNQMLLLASYIFYGYWDWRFLTLLFISTAADYFIGQKIALGHTADRKKRWLTLSILINLGILGFFKYFNFFIDSFAKSASYFGVSANIPLLSIVLPVGISFYTFQTMSYSWDIYRNELKPVKNFIDFALFVSFFPQLVAGPIERAKHLIPQILRKRKISFDQIYEGSYLIFWGYFKKVYIADTLALSVNKVFSLPLGGYTYIDVLIGSIIFAFQIYCDFSGYTDIARGLCKLMGFELMLNFNLPYFSKSPTEFWRRWHISLSTWLRDYLYIPLGGNKKGKLITYRNLMITMLLGGLWHGANINFVIWGFYQGVLLAIHKAWKETMSKFDFYVSISKTKIYKFMALLSTFLLTCYGWLIFRCESFTQLKDMTLTLINTVGEVGHEIVFPSTLLNVAWLLIIIQIWQYLKNDALVFYNWKRWYIRGVVYILLLYFILEGVVNDPQEFIYFQF